MLPHTAIVSLTTQVASVTFDLLFLLVLGSYLIVLFCFLVITTRVSMLYFGCNFNLLVPAAEKILLP
jgi:hypothetical protein